MGSRLNSESSSRSGTPDRDCFFPQLSLNLCNRSKMNANTPSVRANTRENIVSFPTHQKKRGGRKRMSIQRNQNFKKKLINRTTVFASLNRFLHNSHFKLSLKTSASTSISSRPGLVDAFWPRRRLVVVVVLVLVVVVVVVVAVVVAVVVVLTSIFVVVCCVVEKRNNNNVHLLCVFYVGTIFFRLFFQNQRRRKRFERPLLERKKERNAIKNCRQRISDER